MNYEQLWQDCLHEATIRVAVERALHPGCEDMLAFDVGGGSSSGDSEFARRGTSTTQRTFSVPTELGTKLRASYKGSAIPTELAGAENGWLLNLLGLDSASHGGSSLLDGIKGMLSGDFSGASGLSQIIARNPYSQDYENATSTLYNRQFNQARAQAQSGPGNVRGGQARTAFELADLDTQQSMNRFREVRGQADKEAGVVMNAIQLSNMIEQLRRGQQIQAVQTDEAVKHTARADKTAGASQVNAKRPVHTADLNNAAQILGVPSTKTTDNLSGRGSQSSSASNWGVGVTCCFIFLEALNGRLPEFIRLGRDKFNTPNRRAGYKWMSVWLVPAMRKWGLVRWLVNTLMVRPFLYQGFSYFVAKKHSMLVPVCYAWFYLWSFLGWCGLNGEPEKKLEPIYG